jgi:hypothetical protein
VPAWVAAPWMVIVTVAPLAIVPRAGSIRDPHHGPVHRSDTF